MGYYNPALEEGGYTRIGTSAITPSDTVDNLVGVKYIQVTSAATLVFRHKAGSALSIGVPIAANQSFRIGSDMVAVHAAGTTNPGSIIAYYG